MSIPIIEDNAEFSRQLSTALSKNTFINRVDVLGSYGEFSTHKDHVYTYDIILVDLVLASDDIYHHSGFRVISHVKRHHPEIPIIVISSSNAIQDIEYTFSLWATDYMGKDIRYKELEIRVFHWYREYCLNKIGTKQALYDYHGLKYIPIKNEYTYKGNIIELSKSLKYIFSLFYTEQEKLLNEEYLIEKIWGYREDGEAKSALRVSLMRLRDALEKYQLGEWIETARGEGYIFRYPKKS